MAYNPGRSWTKERTTVYGGSEIAWEWVRENLQGDKNIRNINVFYDLRAGGHAITWEEAR